MVRNRAFRTTLRLVDTLPPGLHSSVAPTSSQWPAALHSRNWVLRVRSYLVSLPDILVPGLLETAKLLSPCRDVTNDVEGVL